MAVRCQRSIVACKEINRRIDLWGDDPTQKRMLKIDIVGFWNDVVIRFLRRSKFGDKRFGVAIEIFESFAEITGSLLLWKFECAFARRIYHKFPVIKIQNEADYRISLNNCPGELFFRFDFWKICLKTLEIF